MDALSSALTAIRLTSPLLARMRLGGGVSVSFAGAAPHPQAIPFHFVLSGGCRLRSSELTAGLGEGDMVMLPGAWAHWLETGASGHSIGIIDVVSASGQPLWSPDRGTDSPLNLVIGREPYAAIVLSGIFNFDARQGSLILNELPAAIHMPCAGRSLGGLMRAGLDFVLNEAEQRPGFAATSSRLLEAILTESLRTWALTTTHSPGSLRAVLDEEMAPLIQAIYRRPGHGWSIACIAAFCHQSRSTVARRFHSVLGMSPMAFVAKVRFEHAEWLLRHTKTPTAKIAEIVGYGSAVAFSRAFEVQRGMTPAALRRSHWAPGTP